MKIVRFFGLDSESVIQQAKDHLGEEAVIFSHREIDEGVEVLATAPSQQTAESSYTTEGKTPRTSRREQARIRLHAHLMKLGLGEELSGDLAYKSEAINLSTAQTAIRDAHAELAKRLPIIKQAVIAPGKTIALLGSEATGKTTVLAKLARQVIDNKSIASVHFMTPDKLTHSESVELMQQLAHQNITLTTEIQADDLVRKHRDVEESALTLIDSSALNQKDLRHPEKLISASRGNNIDNYLVLPANLPGSSLEKIVSSITSGMNIKGCIISMVDKADSLGPIFATVVKHQLPIALWSDGENLDSHLYEARAKHLLEKAISVQRNSGMAIDYFQQESRQQYLI